MRVGGFKMNSLAKSNSSFTYRSLVVTITLALLVALGFTNTRAAEEEPLVLGIGTTQDLDSMNPFNTALVVGYEVFSLN